MSAEQESLAPNARIAAAFEFEGIFSTHDSAANAELSMAEVGPDSIVFLENYQLEQANAPVYSRFKKGILQFTGARLSEGNESENYLHMKRSLVEGLNTLLTAADDLPGDQMYMLSTLRALAEKNCAIFFADADDSVPGSYAASYAEEMKRGIATHGLTAGRLSPRLGVLDNYRQGITDYTSFVDTNHGRESDSVGIATTYLHRLLDVEDHLAPDLSRSPAGKMQVYTLWGTRHAYSLAQAYEDAGITMTPKILPDRPVRFISATEEDILPDARRYAISDLAQAAIFESRYYRVEDPLDPTYFELPRTIQVNTAVPPIRDYARLLNLYKDIATTNEALKVASDGATISTLERRRRINAHNLHNLLGEFSVSGAQYLDYSYDPLFA